MLIHCICLSIRRAVQGAGVELYGHMHYLISCFLLTEFTIGWRDTVICIPWEWHIISNAPLCRHDSCCCHDWAVRASGLVLSLAFDDVNIMNFGSYLFLKLFGQMGNGLFSFYISCCPCAVVLEYTGPIRWRLYPQAVGGQR